MPLLLGILGVGAFILWAGTSSAGTSQQGSTPSAWPPSSADVAATSQQVATYAMNTGEIPSGDYQAVVNLMASSTEAYAERCAASGVAPTTAGWKAWLMSEWIAALQQYGIAPGYGPAVQPTNPYVDPSVWGTN